MIVLAGVAVNENRVLIARRLESKSNGGLWEFPGGKLETGESDEYGLVREFCEEFTVAVEVLDFIGNFPYDSDDLFFTLRVYYVRIVQGEFCLIDHSQIKWVKISELSIYDFSPADIPVVKFLQEKHDSE